VSIDPPKKSIDQLYVETDSCTESSRIRFLLQNRFGAILAVHFTIKGTQSLPPITHLNFSQFSPKTLSIFLSSLSLGLSSNKIGRRRKIREALSLLWVISLKLSFSPSLFLYLSLGSTYCEGRRRRRRKIKEKEEKKKKKRIFGF
jgi:hypothetical protein